MNKILLLCWHPGYNFITAGGFVRSCEVMKRMPNKENFIVVDKYPSIYTDLIPSKQLYQYRIPLKIQNLAINFYALERIIEWLLSMLLLVVLSFKVHRQHNIDAIYVPNSEMIVVSIPAVFLHYVFRRKLVFCNGNVEAKSFLTKILLKFSAFLHNTADCVITYSEALKKAQIEAGIKKPILVNSVGIDLELFNDFKSSVEVSGNLPVKTYDMIMVGRLVKEKGIYDLLNIFSRLKQAGLQFKCVVIGEGSPKTKEDLLKHLQTLGISDSVEFTGAVSELDKIKLYYSSKICVFPSYVEGWGIVPQEAMAAGLPVITYDLAVYEENIASCSSVFQVKLSDTKAFSHEVIKLLELSDEEREKLGSIGRTFVKKFDWNTIAQKEYDIINQKDYCAAI